MGKDNIVVAEMGRSIAIMADERKGTKTRCRLLVSGSYTLEAAFIFPVVLGICFAILYSIFFYHDKAILQSNLEEVLLLEAEGRKLNETGKREGLQKQLWLFECQQSEIKKGSLYITGSVSATASLSIPLPAFFLEESQKISLSERYPLIHPASYQRYRKGGKEEKSDGKADSG